MWTKKDGEFEADVVMLVNIYDTKGGFIFKQTHGAQALVYYQWECLRGSLHVIQEKMANYLPPFQFKCIFFGIIIINSFNKDISSKIHASCGKLNNCLIMHFVSTVTNTRKLFFIW